MVGPRPKWVTLRTSTPPVSTSLSIDSPSISRAVATDTGPSPGDLAGLAILDRTADEGGQIEAQHSQIPDRISRLRGARVTGGVERVRGHGRQGVEHVGLERFAFTVGAGLFESLVDETLQRLVDHRHVSLGPDRL